ncbi:MAG: hypothetical protein OEY14_11815, partial [Myxococcales bacterium]|nr:hypothetical protein [Myxococcales bacterium]
MNSIAQTVARRARAAVGFVVWSDRNGLHEAMTSASTQPQASVGTLVFLRGLIVSVLGERSHVIVADVDASNLPASIQATSRSWGARSLAIVPLPGSEAGSGGVGILDPLPRDYEP